MRLSLREAFFSGECPSLGVREGFAGLGVVGDFVRLENFSAVEALDVLRVVILGDELRALMLASRVQHDASFDDGPNEVPIIAPQTMASDRDLANPVIA
jgi:hypothetical protein